MKKAQGKADYFEKELKQQMEKYKRIQGKTATLLEDTEGVYKSYERFNQLINKLAWTMQSIASIIE